MTRVVIDTELFASLVGNYPDNGALLFKVSPPFIEELRDWSKPVRFRFVEADDGLHLMELQRVHQDYIREDPE